MTQISKHIRLGDTFQAIEELANVLQHDIRCWQEIQDKAKDIPTIFAFASGRVESLRIEVNAVIAAITDREIEVASLDDDGDDETFEGGAQWASETENSEGEKDYFSEHVLIQLLLERAQSRIRELENALKPFADQSQWYKDASRNKSREDMAIHWFQNTVLTGRINPDRALKPKHFHHAHDILAKE